MICATCKKRFKPLKENRYTVVLPEPGLLIKNRTWDVFDCPHCGCQNLGSLRYPKEKKEVEI